MKQLGMQSLKQLVKWALSAKKNEIAELAPLVLLMWKQNDKIAQIAVNDNIVDLSDDCVCLIRSFLHHPHCNTSSDSALTHDTKFGRVSVALTGSLFSKDNHFANTFKQRLHSELLKHGVAFLSVKVIQNTALGSLRMLDPLKWKFIPHFELNSQATETLYNSDVLAAAIRCETEKRLAANILPVALGLSLTEKRNERSMNLDTMDVEDAIDLMIVEEQSIFNEIAKNKQSIGILVRKVCKAFQSGGRLFYVGAGTSGRLGNLFVLILHSNSNLIISYTYIKEYWTQVNALRHSDLHMIGFKVYKTKKPINSIDRPFPSLSSSFHIIHKAISRQNVKRGRS